MVCNWGILWMGIGIEFLHGWWTWHPYRNSDLGFWNIGVTVVGRGRSEWSTASGDFFDDGCGVFNGWMTTRDRDKTGIGILLDLNDGTGGGLDGFDGFAAFTDDASDHCLWTFHYSTGSGMCGVLEQESGQPISSDNATKGHQVSQVKTVSVQPLL